jgi:hypothetical protein
MIEPPGMLRETGADGIDLSLQGETLAFEPSQSNA